MNNKGLALILIATVVSAFLVFATIDSYSASFVLKNMLRVCLFGACSFLLYLNPAKIKFFSDHSLVKANVKICMFVAFALSGVNIFLTLMFFIESRSQ